MWLTADSLPPRGSYTPTPAGGFPAIVYSPELLLHGVPPDLIQMYDAVPFPKLFLLVSGGNGAVMRTHGLIRDAIGNFINIDPTSFTLGTPPTAANGTSPSLWLTADIPSPLSQAILDARIISSTGITLYDLPYDMPVISFVGVFAGFTLPNTAMGANTARDLIRTAIEANNEISQFVQTHRDAFGPLVSAGQTWDIFRASVSVHGIVLIVNDTNTVAWRLHVTPPYQQPRSVEPAPPPLRRAAAAKAQEQIHTNDFGAGGSNPRSGNGRGRGAPNTKPRKDGKVKRGGDFKGKGKHRECDDFF
ncbi:hypothetical protein DFH09DRAFT_1192270 [Mycena vulgaris]|nr:hypothetical protein DFH09DRAFT_1192270 [Mycena vulgaris]